MSPIRRALSILAWLIMLFGAGIIGRGFYLGATVHYDGMAGMTPMLYILTGLAVIAVGAGFLLTVKYGSKGVIIGIILLGLVGTLIGMSC